MQRDLQDLQQYYFFYLLFVHFAFELCPLLLFLHANILYDRYSSQWLPLLPYFSQVVLLYPPYRYALPHPHGQFCCFLFSFQVCGFIWYANSDFVGESFVLSLPYTLRSSSVAPPHSAGSLLQTGHHTRRVPNCALNAWMYCFRPGAHGSGTCGSDSILGALARQAVDEALETAACSTSALLEVVVRFFPSWLSQRSHLSALSATLFASWFSTS